MQPVTAVASVNDGCLESRGGRPVLYDHGYLASPNYPDRYFTGAECRWTLSVRRWQTIRVTLFDFELDVKRGGQCHDFVEIARGTTTASARRPETEMVDSRDVMVVDDDDDDERRYYFRECGAMGRQVVDVDDSAATVTFVSGQTSSTQRGFFIYFEGETRIYVMQVDSVLLLSI